MPLPSEDTTPPVTKMSGVTGLEAVMTAAARWKAPFYRQAGPPCPSPVDRIACKLLFLR
jgi:hypothetical protein